VKARPAACLTESLSPHHHIVLAFITSQVPRDLLDTDVLIARDQPDFAQTGLRVSSALRLHRMMTVTTGLIRRDLGRLSPRLGAEVSSRLRTLFDLGTD
jgi:mRNA interferase MazF